MLRVYPEREVSLHLKFQMQFKRGIIMSKGIIFFVNDEEYNELYTNFKKDF